MQRGGSKAWPHPDAADLETRKESGRDVTGGWKKDWARENFPEQLAKIGQRAIV